jgi:anti-sigma regulatory factor (Ser/Thr protein kinase)
MRLPEDQSSGRAGGGPLNAWTFPAESASVPRARRVAAGWLASVGAPVPVTQDVELVLSELVTNAVRASRPGDEIRVELTGEARGWGVAVSDSAGRFVPPATEAVLDPWAVGGRGLRVVSEVAGPLTVEQDHGWTVVRTVVTAASAGDQVTSAGSGRSGQ